MDEFLVVLAGFVFTAFCLAWVTVLPTIGLLWVVGWL